MSNKKIRFCPYCAGRLRLLWPGGGRDADGRMQEGDPESGPREWRCLDQSHGGPQDMIDAAVNDQSAEIIEDFLTRISDGGREDPHDPPLLAGAEFAARVLLANRLSAAQHWGRFAYQCAEEPTRRRVFEHLTRRRSHHQ